MREGHIEAKNLIKAAGNVKDIIKSTKNASVDNNNLENKISCNLNICYNDTCGKHSLSASSKNV